MKELARQTGLTIDQLNQFEHAGAHFSVGVDDMAKIVDGLANQMPEMARGTGNLFKELQKFPQLRQRMLDDYKKGDFSDAIIGALEQAQKVGDKYGPKARQEFLNDLFPSQGEVAERLFGDGGINGFLGQLKKAQKDLNPISPELLQAERRFADAQESFNRGLSNFENSIGPKFLDTLSTILKDGGLALSLLGGKKLPPDEQAKLDEHEEERRKAFQDAQKQAHDAAASEQRKGGAAGEHRDYDEEAIRRGLGLGKKMSYRGGRSLLNLTSFETSAGGAAGSTTSFVEMLADGTKQGFLAAWRELMAQREAEARGGLARAVWSDGSPAGITPGAGGGFGGFGRHGGGGGSGDPLEDGPSVKQGAAGKGMGSRAMWVMSRLKALGWTDEAAASAVGEFMQESSVRGDGPAGDGGMSHGLAQWNRGRFQALMAFAARRHKPWTDLGTQVDFFNAEARARYHGNAWAQTHDLRRAHQFGDAYEGFGDGSGGTRYANAINALRHWRNGGAHDVAKATVEKHLKEMEKRARPMPSPTASPGIVQTSAPAGHVKIDFHAHGEGKVNMKAKGNGISAKLYRWPTMVSPSDFAV